ncbi:MAG: hypothetical protein M1457_04340 [bacterium]|nr:hypothetical protein [bacterium]
MKNQLLTPGAVGMMLLLMAFAGNEVCRGASGPLLALDHKATAADHAAADNFGYSLAISGDTAIVGAPGYNSNTGCAYIFERSDSGWTQVRKLTAADGEAQDFFGRAVAISGDVAMVGAYGDDDLASNSGAVYMYARSGSDWAMVRKLTDPDGESEDYFGWSVALAGNTAVVGIRLDDDMGTNAGAACVFQRDAGGNWLAAAKLTAVDGADLDQFGASVAINGDTILVGAYGNDAVAADGGAAYVFKRDGSAWTQVKRLTAADGAGLAFFGWSVSISDDTALIGALNDNPHGPQSGSAYVFRRDEGGSENWGQTAKLAGAETSMDHQFGCSVAVSGDVALIGASGDTTPDIGAGAAYLFLRDDSGAWRQAAYLKARDAAGGDNFGFAVALSGDTGVVGAFGARNSFAADGSVRFYHLLLLAEDEATAADGAAGDAFGTAVSVAGDLALIGAPDDDEAGADSGSAYVFARNATGWSQVARLTAADAAAGDRFGYAVALDGDTAIVGAYGDSDNGAESGSAYIYQRDQGGTGNWGQVKKLTTAAGGAGSRFGYAVAIAGDTAVVGAYGDSDNGTGSGAIYIFQRDQGGADNWGLLARRTDADPATDDNFGWTVAIASDTIAAGSLHDDDKGFNSGSAVIFQRDRGGAGNWGQVTKITAADGDADDLFGTSVTIAGDTAVVGARSDDDRGAESGSAYVFLRNEGGADAWGQAAKLTASDGAPADFFGDSVAVAGNNVLVGAAGNDDKGADSGSAYLFVREGSTWTQRGNLTAAAGAAGDACGAAVAASGGAAVAGAPGSDANGSGSGAAYFYALGTGPVVRSITRLNPTLENTGQTRLTFRVTFDRTAHHVQTGNFSLTTTGGQSGAAVTSVSAASGSAIDVTVQATTGGIGTIRLDLTNPSSITDTWFNAMTESYTGGESYSIVPPPPAPVVAGPGLYTNDATPTWTWSSGGGTGNGVFRYKLDNADLNSGAVQVSAPPYEFTPATGLADGLHTFYIQERNDQGAWSQTAGYTLSLDTALPVFSGVTSTAIAKLGTVVTVAFTTSEILGANPTVTINGHAATFQSVNGADYVYSYAVAAGDPDGRAAIAIAGTDLAANNGIYDNDTLLLVDKTRPTGGITFQDGADYTTTTAVTYTLTADDGGGSGVDRFRVSTDGSSWSGWEVCTAWPLVRNLTLSGGDGTKTIYAAYMDLAGNITIGTISDSIILDAAAPSFSELDIWPVLARLGTVVTITFTASEELAANPAVTVNGHSAVFQSVIDLYYYMYTYTIDATDPNGPAAIAISGSDLAGIGGSTSNNNLLVVDKPPPVFGDFSASPAAARLGSQVAITFTASEALGADPIVTVNGHLASYQSYDGFLYTYAYTVAGDPNGNATITVSGSDLAGNAGMTSNTNALRVDLIAPSFNGITANPNSGYAGQVIEISFTPSEALSENPVEAALDGNPAVTVNGNRAAYMNITGSTYAFTYIIRTEDPLSSANIIVTGTDISGNPGSTASTSALTVVPHPPRPNPPGVSDLIGAVAIHDVSSQLDDDHNAIHMVDGSGLILGGNGQIAEPPTHAASESFGFHSWLTDPADAAPWIIFDLGESHELMTIHIWNLNLADPGNQLGAKWVAIDTSVDGLVWTTHGLHHLPMASGTEGDPGFDIDATRWAAARYVRFTIPVNYALSGSLGLSEVRFFARTPGLSDYRPTWVWISGGGGSEMYRYKFDDDDFGDHPVSTTDPQFTPDEDLSPGAHTLYVQERDIYGYWSDTGSYTIFIKEPQTAARNWLLYEP